MAFEEKKINEFMQRLASKDAIPGGGGASALVGAIGVSLVNMVGALTVGKKKYADVADDIKAIMAEGELLRKEMLSMMDKDAEAFTPLVHAYSIPKDMPGRDEIMENALRAACEAPLELMRTVCRALDLMEEIAAKGSETAISDAGVGVVCCKAALKAASLNVFINTEYMQDRYYADKAEKEADAMLEKYSAVADEIYDIVVNRIRS